ncbi:hypothetical protein NT239_09765 [Chitinibacter sp. SCUT-21]|uniref:hypothetical protein n=1 Tax=Chitinibacter sp. SCUT-21 TaxID=2970891 RepID=UPI0035A658D7
MATYSITPDFDALALGLDANQSKVYQQLCTRRQCTSAELIQRCHIHNPHAIIESINLRLKALHSEWLILASNPRAPLSGPTQSMRVPLAYYRLRKTVAISRPERT